MLATGRFPTRFSITLRDSHIGASRKFPLIAVSRMNLFQGVIPTQKFLSRIVLDCFLVALYWESLILYQASFKLSPPFYLKVRTSVSTKSKGPDLVTTTSKKNIFFVIFDKGH